MTNKLAAAALAAQEGRKRAQPCIGGGIHAWREFGNPATGASFQACIACRVTKTTEDLDRSGRVELAAAAGCGACEVETLIGQVVEAEGLALGLFDDVTVIAGRLASAGVTIADVRAALYLGQPVNSAVFWRAVYGPAYPAAVMA